MQTEPEHAPSKEELFEWASALLRVKLNKLSQFSTGVHLCQVFDIVFPRRLNLSKVVMRPTNDFEVQGNVRLLLEELKKADPKRTLSSDKIMKSPYEDALAVLVWLKHVSDEKQTKQQPRKENSRESLFARPNSIESQIATLQPKKLVRSRVTEVSSLRQHKPTTKLDCQDVPMMPVHYAPDELRIKEIEELLQNERELKASSKIEKIKRILFGGSKYQRMVTPLHSEAKSLIQQENMSVLANSRVVPLPVRFEDNQKFMDRGRESLLLNVPSPDETVEDQPRKSMNLLDCYPEST